MRVWPLLLLAFLAAPLAGQKEDWHVYKSDEGHFSILMPTDPEESVNAVEGGIGVSRTIRAASGGVVYMVVYVAFNSDQPVNEASFKQYKNSFSQGLPTCKETDSAAPSPDIPGFIGRWYRMDCQINNVPMTFVGNLYWGQRYAYAVMVIFASAPSDPPAAKKFTESFQTR
jgi:hypothetical protein